MYIKNYIKIQFEGVQIDLMKIFVEKQNTVKKSNKKKCIINKFFGKKWCRNY